MHSSFFFDLTENNKHAKNILKRKKEKKSMIVFCTSVKSNRLKEMIGNVKAGQLGNVTVRMIIFNYKRNRQKKMGE